MRIQFVSAELAPIAQTGGLGDAVAGLAAALSALGHTVTCVMPAYRTLLDHPECPALESEPGPRLPDVAGEVAWRLGTLPSGVRLRLLDAKALYDRPALYGEADDEVLRFASLSRAAAIRALEERPEILVAHDWHASLSIAMLRTLFDGGAARTIGTVQVVHNNAYQGRFPAGRMAQTGLPEEFFQPEGVELFGELCLLKAGLIFAERVVAVSPRYAEELQTAEQGVGLDGLYRARAHRLIGITNGIDTDRWDPAKDAALPAPFSAEAIEGRAVSRQAVVGMLGLGAPPPGRFLAAIGRFAHQKGWDVLAEALPDLVALGSRVAILGDGDPGISRVLHQAADDAPGQIHLEVGWNEGFARRLYGAADAVLIPSRFEPCGLVQLLAQRYGCLPVAHRVGGLVDTIRDGETGVLFAPLSSSQLLAGAERAARLVTQRGTLDLSRDLASLDVSWARSAALWESVLHIAAQEARARA